ncbi:MAG: flippase-like domain-containing protein [Bacteroidetes bacterium]|nr:flippase-like domain-containing protein [Bacteroidota bacterium]
MNKSTKQALKLGAGILVMALLCWHLYRQIVVQMQSGFQFQWWPASGARYFIVAVLLLPLNIALEAVKWRSLLSSVRDTSFVQALRSVLFGIGASVVTPNRLGDYPGRLLALQERHSTRLISVSVLGAISQLMALMLFGCVGLIYYITLHPASYNLLLLVFVLVLNLLLFMFYFSFERWAGRMERIAWLRRVRLWARYLRPFTTKDQVLILAISCLRVLVFVVQFWLLLRWQGVALSFPSGMLLCSLFFWAMAVIPSIALAELGVRGTVAVFLFGAFTENIAGITLAVLVIWLLNLMLPGLLGSLLYFQKKDDKVL